MISTNDFVLRSELMKEVARFASYQANIKTVDCWHLVPCVDL